MAPKAMAKAKAKAKAAPAPAPAPAAAHAGPALPPVMQYWKQDALQKDGFFPYCNGFGAFAWAVPGPDLVLPGSANAGGGGVLDGGRLVATFPPGPRFGAAAAGAGMRLGLVARQLEVTLCAASPGAGAGGLLRAFFGPPGPEGERVSPLGGLWHHAPWRYSGVTYTPMNDKARAFLDLIFFEGELHPLPGALPLPRRTVLPGGQRLGAAAAAAMFFRDTEKQRQWCLSFLVEGPRCCLWRSESYPDGVLAASGTEGHCRTIALQGRVVLVYTLSSPATSQDHSGTAEEQLAAGVILTLARRAEYFRLGDPGSDLPFLVLGLPREWQTRTFTQDAAADPCARVWRFGWHSVAGAIGVSCWRSKQLRVAEALGLAFDFVRR